MDNIIPVAFYPLL